MLSTFSAFLRTFRNLSIGFADVQVIVPFFDVFSFLKLDLSLLYAERRIEIYHRVFGNDDLNIFKSGLKGRSILRTLAITIGVAMLLEIFGIPMIMVKE